MTIAICKMPKWLPTRTSLFQKGAGIAMIGLSLVVAYPV